MKVTLTIETESPVIHLKAIGLEEVHTTILDSDLVVQTTKIGTNDFILKQIT